MKYKYYKIMGEIAWGVNILTKQDLADIKTKRYDLLINVEEGKVFNAETNEWDKIPGESD